MLDAENIIRSLFLVLYLIFFFLFKYVNIFLYVITDLYFTDNIPKKMAHNNLRVYTAGFTTVKKNKIIYYKWDDVE